MGREPGASWTVEDLVQQVGAPLEQVLTALYHLIRHDTSLDRFASLNPGCSEEELDAAEVRIRHRLHPLHRRLLQLSNGGSFPFSGSVSTLAAAVPREQEWRIVGPFLTPDEQATQLVLVDRMLHPVVPLLLGQDPPDLDRADMGPALDGFIIFADGFGDEGWGYVRGEPDRIDCYVQVRGGGRYPAATDFATFLRQQTLYQRVHTPAFVQLVRSALARR
jgi:hypothetical protein